MKSVDLTKTLSGRRAGEWVVLNESKSRVLAAAETAGAALRKAAKLSGHRNTLLMQVPDPNTVCIY